MSTGPRPLIFGEVLFDRFPDGSEVLGGAPFNVAWNLRGLGQDPLFLSRVGQDLLGDRIVSEMAEFGLDPVGLQRDRQHPTGTVEVSLVDGEPRFDIIADRAYDFIEPMDDPFRAGLLDPGPALIYHGSLVLRGEESAQGWRELLDWVRKLERSVPVFFDVNLRSPWWDPSSVEDWMKMADHIKLNEDELAALVPEPKTLAHRAQALLARTSSQAVYVTRGAEGAVAFTANGDEVSTAPSREVPVVDTVGAGDAFASVLILGLLEGWSLSTRLDRAREFAEAVVGIRGATTTQTGFYSRMRMSWSSA